MNTVYYCKVYVELLYTISRYCTYNDYTWKNLTFGLMLLRGLVIRFLEKRSCNSLMSSGHVLYKDILRVLHLHRA